MSDTYEFYKEQYNEIQRHAYYFLNEVSLPEEEQRKIVKKFSLGTDFVTINSVQDYNNDWLIKGYVKVDIREVKGPTGNIKGKFLDTETFLKESMVQLPKRLFELKDEELKKEIYGCCMEIASKRIHMILASLRMQKIQIEEEIERYSDFIRKYPIDETE